MAKNLNIEKLRKFIRPYRITDGKDFRLKDIDPGDTADFDKDDKQRITEALEEGVELLSELQERLYADDKWAVLLVFQAMDAAGKDGVIKHVFSGINPQGCHVTSFKSPSSEDLDHDYLWRCSKNLPERGRFGIFNRSYYEEVLVVKVHPEYLASQKLPKQALEGDLWKKRYNDISQFEKYLHHNGILVLKFFLHVSKKEQKERFMERLDNPDKNWKFSAADVKERGFWDQYQQAYEEMIRNTATDYAPWFVVPADKKWFTRAVVASAIIEALHTLDPRFPVLDARKMAELDEARTILNEER